MHRLKTIKETLVTAVEGQLAHLDCVNTKELGEVVDMIKDLEEAMYYCSIVKAMEEAEKIMEKEDHETRRHYYTRVLPESAYPYEHGRDIDRHMGRMYYSPRQPRNSRGEFTKYYDGDREGSSMDGRNHYGDRELFRDTREGRSPMSRRMYMESKELHKDKASKVKELERYMKELGEDIIEMIEDASPEERQVLEKKMTTLTSKVAQLND